MVNYFLSPHLAVKKIIHRIKRWKRIIQRHRERGEKKLIHRDSPHSPQKDVRNTRWKLFFFTAFHRISYENSPPNLDPGMTDNNIFEKQWYINLETFLGRCLRFEPKTCSELYKQTVSIKFNSLSSVSRVLLIQFYVFQVIFLPAAFAPTSLQGFGI